MILKVHRLAGQEHTRDMYQPGGDERAPEWVRQFVDEHAYDWFHEDSDFVATALFGRHHNGVRIQMWPIRMKFSGCVWIDFAVFVMELRGNEFKVTQYPFTAKLYGTYTLEF